MPDDQPGEDESWRWLTSPGLVSIDTDPDRRAFFASPKPIEDGYDDNAETAENLTAVYVEGDPRPRPLWPA